MNNLPPLDKKAFDGEKFEAPIPQKASIKSCDHKKAKLINDRELQCPCGAGWIGFGVDRLKKAIDNP